MQPTTPNHPVEFDVDYPDRPLDRFSTLLRPVFATPILVVLAVLGGPAFGAGGGLFFIGLASGLVVVPPLLTIVFREKYPRWWFDFTRFSNRKKARLRSATSSCCATSSRRRTKSNRSTSRCPTPMSAPTSTVGCPW